MGNTPNILLEGLGELNSQSQVHTRVPNALFGSCVATKLINFNEKSILGMLQTIASEMPEESTILLGDLCRLIHVRDFSCIVVICL
jgi:hypothetical protein